MRRRSIVALLVYLPTNAVLFGIGAVTILVVPALNARADVLIPVVVAASFILAAPIAWMLAPRLQARSFGRRGHQPDAAASHAGVAGGGRPRRD